MSAYKNILSRSFGPVNDREKALANRLNMGRLYIFNIFASAAVIILTAVFALFRIYLLPSDYQTMGFMIFALCLVLSGLAVYATAVTKQTELFEKECLIYIGMFTAVMFNFAFRSTSNITAIIFFWVAMMVQSVLPYLNPRVYSIIVGIDVIPTVILGLVRNFSTESVITIVCIYIMSYSLSMVNYSSIISRLDYKLTLDNAVTQAETDPMTQLLNRRGLDRRLVDVWPHCIRQNACVAVLMIDIDNFKKYNDTFGHAAGDDCIRKVTGAIRKCIRRRTDYGARVGGEEFLVLLTGIEPKEAVKWCLELKHTIDGLKIPHAKTNFNPYVSVSMGLACSVLTNDITFEQLREEADKSLYEAKNGGRNRLYYRHRAFGAAVPPAGATASRASGS